MDIQNEQMGWVIVILCSCVYNNLLRNRCILEKLEKVRSEAKTVLFHMHISHWKDAYCYKHMKNEQYLKY
jgi:hypothetical protein